MADITYQNVSTPERPRISWAAIWAGVFTFIAIWSVFGMLGMAIFATAANPNAQQPISGMNVGMAVWAIILTIIAMYVAGRVTGSLAAAPARQDGLIHGMAMFGLSVVAALLLVMLGGTSVSSGTGVSGTAHNPYVLGVLSGLGWTGFVSLFLGWLAALGGAASTGSGSSHRLARQEPAETENIHHARTAA
jgi:hypothetical protein